VVLPQQPALPPPAAPLSLQLETLPPIRVASPLPVPLVDAMRSRAYGAEQPLRPRDVAFPRQGEPPQWQAPGAAAEQSFSEQAWIRSPPALPLVSPLPDSPEPRSPPRALVQAQPVPPAAAA
jgi:hypothetical protein